MPATNVFDLPQNFTRTITGMFGADGEKWLVSLPRIVAEISADWSLTVAEPLKNLSYHYVAPCVCADGEEAILKIGFPEEKTEFLSETKTLRLYNGEGTVRLLRTNEKRYAMLLEKLVPGETLGKMCLQDDRETVRIGADILIKIVREAPEEHGFHKLDDWYSGLRRAKETAFPAEIVKNARRLYQELSGKTKRKFLLHGDFHHENILSATRAPYLVIDPKGLIGDPGYDIGVFLNNHRNWLEGERDMEIKLDSAVEQFSTVMKIPAVDIRNWAFIQCILSAWWTFEENSENWQPEVSKAAIWQV